MKKLSIIIPVFNEEKTIKHILEKVSLVKLPSGITKEIIVVDDYSSDKTSQILSTSNIGFKYIRRRLESKSKKCPFSKRII